MGKIVNPQIVIVKGGDTPTPPTTGAYFVKVIDFDGTVLKSANLNNGDTFELPTPPSHDGLVFQEYSSSQAITDNKITINNNNVMIGAVYTTASGLSEFDIELTTVTGLTVTLNMSGTKNWGDGTSDTGTTHTYSAVGSYTITCDGTSFSDNAFGQNTTNKNFFCKNIRLANITSLKTNHVFEDCYSLTSITIPNSVTSIGYQIFANDYSLNCVIFPEGVDKMGSYLFNSCYLLKKVVIPNSVTSIGYYAFDSCYSLTDIAFPNSVTSINTSFRNCYSLNNIIIPSNVTSIGSVAFTHCYSLNKVVIPNSVTSMDFSAFDICYSLNKVVIPNSITSIKSTTFRNCYSLKEYDFSSFTSVPTLANTDAFSGINGICKMKIPSALIDEWKTATNWATYADYMVAV